MKKRKKAGIIATVFVVAVLLVAVCVIWAWKGKTNTTKNITDYEKFFGSEGKHRKNGLITNDIFPVELPKSATVEKFCYQNTDILDPCDTAILVYTCDADDYAAEVARLEKIGTSEEAAYGVYGITDFPYKVCAVTADNYYGIVYAMTEEEEHRIIYVENTHCNYFSDNDYEELIGNEYLPSGYDASKDNPQRKQFEENGM